MRRRIAVIGYDGVGTINLAGPLEAFSNACQRTDAGEETPCYDVSFIVCTGSQCITDTGITFSGSSSSIDDKEAFDTVIVPGGKGLRRADIRAAVARWIAGRAASTRRIASICTGIYALASTGLVNGRRVTTHWKHARDVAERFPKLKVEESALFLKDGRFYSSAGATAGIDLSLSLIDEDFGHKVALHVARNLLVYIARDGGQEQYSEPKAAEFNREVSERQQWTRARMNRLVRWITGHLADDLRLESLAKRAGLTENNLWAQFSKTFGVSPALFVKNLRLNEARRRLSHGDTVCDVAKTVGLRDEYFGQEFRRRFGALPDDYQRRFGSANMSERKSGSSSEEVSMPLAKRSCDGLRGNYQRPRIISFTRSIRGRRPELS